MMAISPDQHMTTSPGLDAPRVNHQCPSKKIGCNILSKVQRRKAMLQDCYTKTILYSGIHSQRARKGTASSEANIVHPHLF